MALARQAGRVDVDTLTSHCAVTPQTITKDLSELCDSGVMQRYHSGAMLASGGPNLGCEARRCLAPATKRHIAKRAAEIIPDNCSLLVNIDTTTEQVAMALRQHQGLIVITNINVVSLLQGFPQIEVLVAGGTLRHCG